MSSLAKSALLPASALLRHRAGASVATVGSMSLRLTHPRFNSTAAEPESTEVSKPTRFLPSLSLHDKVCVITGAARGLGNTFAEAFLESGCNKLAILDLDETQASAAGLALVHKLESSGVLPKGEIEAIGFGVDVSDEMNVAGVMKGIVDKWGKIDSLVTSAGIVENLPALDYPVDKIKRLYDINVHGSYFCAREVAKEMIRTKTNGSITLVASMSGLVVNVPQPQAPYNASKAAVIQMAKSFAVEWAQYNIRVNSLSPGYMRTPLVADVLRNAQNNLEEAWIARTPAQRLGTPEDLKGAIVLLASDAGSFITGSNIIVDGGYTAI